MKRIWGKKGWPGNSLYRGEEVAVPKKLLSKLRATEMTDRRAGSSRRRMKMSHRYVAYCPPNLQTDTHLQVLCGVKFISVALSLRQTSQAIEMRAMFLRAFQLKIAANCSHCEQFAAIFSSSDAVKEAVCTCTRRPMLTAYFYRQADLHSGDCRI